MTLFVIGLYLAALVGIGLASNRVLTGTSRDYLVASHSIGPVLLFTSIFGTTMTAFAIVGSTGESYREGIAVFGLMASWSALIHPAVFYFVGVRLWAFGKKYGYTTQAHFFRDRFESDALALLLFPILVALVVPYVMIGILGAGSVVQAATVGAFPEMFPGSELVQKGAVPLRVTAAVVCAVVFIYVSFGGARAATWANALQTLVFVATGVAAFLVIADALGGPAEASRRVLEAHPERLSREHMPALKFLSYGFVPLSVGMFPHLFQHWLTAKSARDFKLTLVLHPLGILCVWAPCVLVGVWATSAVMPAGSLNAGDLVVSLKHAPNSELGILVTKLTSPLVTGLLTAGIFSATIGTLDSQFLCLGTMFQNDIVLRLLGPERVSERAKVWIARAFVLVVVFACYGLALYEPRRVFTLGVWCFNGFAALFPLAFAAIHWRRATKHGAIASVVATAILWTHLFIRAEYGKTEGMIGDVMPVVPLVLTSTVALVVVSLCTRPPSEGTIAKFIPRKPAT